MDRPDFHDLAEQELNEAAQYYDLEEPGLGSAFLDEVERCCSRSPSTRKPAQFSKTLFVVASYANSRMRSCTRSSRPASGFSP
jgi:hypothetical protein